MALCDVVASRLQVASRSRFAQLKPALLTLIDFYLVQAPTHNCALPTSAPAAPKTRADGGCTSPGKSRGPPFVADGGCTSPRGEVSRLRHSARLGFPPSLLMVDAPHRGGIFWGDLFLPAWDTLFASLYEFFKKSL